MKKTISMSKLVWKTETFVYLVPIPMILYYGIVCLEFTASKLITFGVSASLGGVIGFLVGAVFRYTNLPLLFRQLESQNQSKEEDITLKKKLLEYPKIEAFASALRWLIGGGSAWLVLIFWQELKLVEKLAIPVAITIAIPSTSICFYFITEAWVAELIESSRLSNLDHPIFFKNSFTMEKRILYLLFSILSASSGTLGFLFYFVNSGELHFTHAWLHTIILLILQSILGYIGVKNISITIDRSISSVSNVLSDLSEGKVHNFIPIASVDEYGKMASNINLVLSALREVIYSVQKLIKDMFNSSQKLDQNSAVLYKITKEQSLFISNISSDLIALKDSIEQIAQNAKNSYNITEKTKASELQLQNEMETLLEHSHQGGIASQNTLELVNQGRENIQENIHRMEDIQETTNKIKGIVDAIGEIADQVNLLSLNASIESARAGEYGRGFAVVAGEVSKLAEKTLQNSGEIAKFSNTVSKKVIDGKTAIHSTCEVFEGIFQKVSDTKAKIDQILESIRRQALIGKQFNEAFQNSLLLAEKISNLTETQTHTSSELIKNITNIQQGSKGVEESSSQLKEISTDLVEKVQEIKQKINFFQLVK
jgi:methyl-accepting chemotaxis protein